MIKQAEEAIINVEFESFIGTQRNVSIKNLNLNPASKLEDVEPGSTQMCRFNVRRCTRELLFQIVTNTPELANE